MRFEEEPVEKCEWQGFYSSIKQTTNKENGASNEFVRQALSTFHFSKTHQILCFRL